MYLQVLFLESKEGFGLQMAFCLTGKLQTLLKPLQQTPTPHSPWQRPNTQTNPQEPMLLRWHISLFHSSSSVILCILFRLIFSLSLCFICVFSPAAGGPWRWSPDHQPSGQLFQFDPRGRTSSHPHLHRRQRRYGRPHHRCLPILTIQLPPLLLNMGIAACLCMSVCVFLLMSPPLMLMEGFHWVGSSSGLCRERKLNRIRLESHLLLVNVLMLCVCRLRCGGKTFWDCADAAARGGLSWSPGVCPQCQPAGYGQTGQLWVRHVLLDVLLG